jgi:tripartite-type tricarboxylate transporter receptor subunit TctC
MTTPEEFTAFVGREVAKWRDVIRSEGLVMELG